MYVSMVCMYCNKDNLRIEELIYRNRWIRFDGAIMCYLLEREREEMEKASHRFVLKPFDLRLRNKVMHWLIQN